MNDYTQLIPKMLSGNELIKELSVIPEYVPSIINRDIGERLVALTNIYDIYIPSKMSIEIYNKLYLALYHSLQKKSSNLALSQKYENYKKILLRPSNSIIGGADSFTIIGTSGIGKSSAINRAIHIIEKKWNPDNIKLDTKVVPFVNVQCPFDSSVKGLAIEILLKIDKMLGINYYNQNNAYKILKRCTTDVLIGQISTIAINNIGVLVVDEIQNVANSKNGKNLIGFLTQLINNSGISICMVGTPESILFFEGAPHLARRTMGLNYTTLHYDEYFKNMCKILFNYQYTSTKELDDNLSNWLYEHSSGNISIIISLVHDAQEIAIMSGRDSLDIQSLTEAYDNRISMFHKYIDSVKIVHQNNKIRNNSKSIVNKNNKTNLQESLVLLLQDAKKQNVNFIDILKKHITVEEVKI